MEELRTQLQLPDWVPEGAMHYIAHTEQGTPIRALARQAGCHASTVLRQIRKVEMRRDDPLVDAALRKLSAGDAVRKQHSLKNRTAQTLQTGAATPKPTSVPDEDALAREAPRVLRRLCENGAVLAVAAEMEKAVVVRDTPEGGSARTAVVDASLAQAMALKDWIAPLNAGRIVRYQITGAGRTALSQMIAGFKQTVDTCPNEEDGWQETESALADTPKRQRMRYALAESPLVALSRRRDVDGKPFLSDALVHAGERLREDFELAQMDARTTQNWDSFLTAGTGRGQAGQGPSDSAPTDARTRVAAALNHLGPGLSDVALRCCCYLEGMETTEKRLGWSARSGKIVLRIALIRLNRHYEETIGTGGGMIG